MKISPIQQFAYSRQNYSNNVKQQVSFNGASPELMGRIRKTLLEDKLAVAFNLQKQGDLVVVSKNPKNILSVLEEFLEKFPTPIRRLLFIKDHSINETLCFSRTLDGQPRLINCNEDPITIDDLEEVDPGETTTLDIGDNILVSSQAIEMKDVPDVDFDLEENASLFIQTIDNSAKADDFTKSHNKALISSLIDPPKSQKGNITFANVGGQDANIELLKKNVLFPMKYPEVFKGFMQNHGVVLAGPPGTGKSLLAQALATEAAASVFELCATDLSDKYVGESERKCRELFQKAVDAQPGIINLDEFDALGKARGGQDVYNDNLLNQFLALMSDLEKRGDNVYVIASTNRKDTLDAAVMRSGRFGLQLEVNPPDLKGTKHILGIHLKHKPVDENVDIEVISQKMHAKKMTGADIAVTVKEAFSQALERTGIYESMANGRFSPAQMDYFKIIEDDFTKAIENFKPSDKNRNPIGYNK